MNIFTKPKVHPPGTKSAGVLFIDMKPRSEINPCAVWRVVNGNWKLIIEDKPVQYGHATESKRAEENGRTGKKAAKVKKKRKK